MKTIRRWTGVLVAGLLVGLIAVLFMTLVMAFLRLFLGVPLPAEIGGDRFLPTFTVNEFLGILARNGGPMAAKRTALLAGWGGQIAFGAAFGVLYAIVVEWGRVRNPQQSRRFGISRGSILFVAVSVALIWAVTVAVLWPVLAASNLGLPPVWASVTTALGLLVVYASYGVALVLIHRLITSRAPLRQTAPVGSAEGQPIGRRAFLAGAGGLVVAAGSGGLVRKLYNDSTLPYDGLKYQGPDIQHITPNDRFYVVTKNIIDPNPTKAAWRLRVDGMVERPTTYDFADLASMPSVEQEQTLSCISNGIGGGLMSNAVWRGTPLRNFLEDAGVSSGAVDVKLHAADGYTHDVFFEKAMEETTLVAYEMNGVPLPTRHGYPARVLVPGYYGEGSVKWVTRIEIFDRQVEDEYYGKQGWVAEKFHTVSRFDTARFSPQQPTSADTISLKAGETTTMKGAAFSGDRGISRVEVSTDGGRSWRGARIDYSPSRIVWAFWSYDWRPEGPGRHDLAVRATDGDGRPQIERKSGISDGITGLHELVARVQA